MRTRAGSGGIEPRYDPRTDIPAGVRPLEHRPTKYFHVNSNYNSLFHNKIFNIYALTGGSSRPEVAPSLLLPVLLLVSSPPPTPGSAYARSHPPLPPQRARVGLYPERGRMAGFPPSVRAGDTREREKNMLK